MTWLETLDEGYDLFENQYQAYTDSTVSVDHPDILGFTYDPTHQASISDGIVLPDGSTMLIQIYQRNIYTITFISNSTLYIQSMTAYYQ